MAIVEKVRSGARSWGLLGGAVVLGLLAFFVSTWYLQRRSRAIEDELFAMMGEKRQVVVATMPLAPGAVIGPENMAIAEIAIANLSEQAAGPEAFADFEGKVLTTPMSPGEPLLSHFVAGTSAERFSDLLLEGERAVTISVDQIMSSDGMLIYGDRVDLMLLIDEDSQGAGEQKPDTLLPLLQNVRVLSVGKRALVTRDADLSNDAQNPDVDETYSTLTVGVSADAAARLLLARDLGSITVMLRNRTDKSPFDSQLLARDSLFSSNPDADTFEYYAGSQVDNGKLKLSVQSVDGKAAAHSAGASGATAVEPAAKPAEVIPLKSDTSAP